METIFSKIDRAAIFVSDLTYVADRAAGARFPNANVCIEHGYALKVLSWRRLIAVMNTAMGHPDEHELPFDVRHTRRPILFECSEDATPEARQRVRDELTTKLVEALKAIFGDKAARAAITGAAEPAPDIRKAASLAALDELALDINRGGVPEIVTAPRVTLRLVPFAASEDRRLDPRQAAAAQLHFPPSIEGQVRSDFDGRQWYSCATPKII
jgi:hypothetical protein